MATVGPQTRQAARRPRGDPGCPWGVPVAVVHSYLATAAKWCKDKYQALTELFTTGSWQPPAIALG